jgi:hypothetical protein
VLDVCRDTGLEKTGREVLIYARGQESRGGSVFSLRTGDGCLFIGDHFVHEHRITTKMLLRSSTYRPLAAALSAPVSKTRHCETCMDLAWYCLLIDGST